MQGRDIAPLYLAEAPPSWRQDFFYEHAVINNKDFIPASQALVERSWKYLCWPDFGREQLFHLQEDPREEHDLAGDPAQAARMETMRKRFRELRDAAR
jgi:arylsulfatase A-like enzyme